MKWRRLSALKDALRNSTTYSDKKLRLSNWRLSESDNNDRSGDVFRSRVACSLESSSNLMTCRGDHKGRMPYHSQSSSPTAAPELVPAVLDRRRRSKTPSSFGSLLKASAIRRSTLTVRGWIFSSCI